MEHFLPSPGSRRRSLLWILSLPAGPNGATLRYLNYSKWLRKAGYSVHFAVSELTFNQDQLTRLVDDGWIDGFSKLTVYRATGARNAFSRLFVFPRLRNRIMAGKQAPIEEELAGLVRRHDAGVCIVSDRNYLFSVSALAGVARVVIDWCDSSSLFHWRALLHSIRSNNWRQIPGLLHEGLVSVLEERYYPELSHANLVVSPADQKAIRRICPAAADLRIVLNGIDSPDRAGDRIKVRNRLVFSGTMDFPPNYEGALWFIDHVLPLVRKLRPEVHLVIAGANPIAGLKARESEAVHVTGLVKDMSRELAQASLYVAPLISGGGFKNKVFEAIAAGTAVVGTPLAAEFLPPDLDKVVLVARNAGNFADTIIQCLDKPDLLAREIKQAQQFLRLYFSWQARTAGLLSVLDPSGKPHTPVEADTVR